MVNKEEEAGLEGGQGAKNFEVPLRAACSLLMGLSEVGDLGSLATHHFLLMYTHTCKCCACALSWHPLPLGEGKAMARKQERIKSWHSMCVRGVSGRGQVRQEVESQCCTWWWWLCLSSVLPLRGLESDSSCRTCSPSLQQDPETKPFLVVPPRSSS